MRKIAAVAAVLAGLAWGFGCEHDSYEITMRPDGQQMERTVAVSHVGGGKVSTLPGQPTTVASHPASAPSPAEREALAKLYGKGVESADGNGSTYRGTVTDPLPDDVGNYGRYASFTTQLGTAHGYVESFRGSDDGAAMLERQFQAVDDVVDVLVAGAKARYGQRKDFIKLWTFLTRDLRKDLKNIGAYAWAWTLAQRQVINGSQTEDAFLQVKVQTAMRLAAYLLKRDYITQGDIPTIQAMFMGDQASPDSDRSRQTLLRALLVRKVGLQEKALVDELVSLLTKPEEMGAAMAKRIVSTPALKNRMLFWAKYPGKGRMPSTAPTEEAMATEWLDARTRELLPIDLDLDLLVYDKMAIRLKCSASPITNGKWDSAKGQIVWEFRVPSVSETTKGETHSNEVSAPVLCYALWAQPDVKYQLAHFGRKLGDSTSLVYYCVWRKGLSKAQGDEWDKFLDGLRPGADLADKLTAFRFPGAASKPGQVAKPVLGAEIIVGALSAK